MATTDPPYGGYDAPIWSQVGSGGFSESQLAGYVIVGETRVTNFFASPLTGTSFAELGAGVSLRDSEVSTARGGVYFRTDSGYTGTLTSDALGTASFDDAARIWTSSASYGGVTRYTLSEFDSEMAAQASNPSIYGVGLTVLPTNEATLTAFSVNGNKYLFTPRGLGTVAETSTTLAAFTSSGFTATTPESNGLGEVTLGYRPAPADAIAGHYSITFSSRDSDATRVQSFDLTVTDAGAGGTTGTSAAVLAATGAEPLGLIATAGALSVLGAGILATIAIRRRKAIR